MGADRRRAAGAQTSADRLSAADPDVGGLCLTGMVVAKTQYYTATVIDGFIADQDNSPEWPFQAVPSSGKEYRRPRPPTGRWPGFGRSRVIAPGSGCHSRRRCVAGRRPPLDPCLDLKTTGPRLPGQCQVWPRCGAGTNEAAAWPVACSSRMISSFAISRRTGAGTYRVRCGPRDQ